MVFFTCCGIWDPSPGLQMGNTLATGPKFETDPTLATDPNMSNIPNISRISSGYGSSDCKMISHRLLRPRNLEKNCIETCKEKNTFSFLEVFASPEGPGVRKLEHFFFLYCYGQVRTQTNWDNFPKL